MSSVAQLLVFDMEWVHPENDSIDLWPTDRLFEQPERLCNFGSSGSGKTTFVVGLVKKYHESFHTIILCGQANDLLKLKETAHKTHLYRPQSSTDEIFDPFTEIELHQIKKKKRSNIIDL